MSDLLMDGWPADGWMDGLLMDGWHADGWMDGMLMDKWLADGDPSASLRMTGFGGCSHPTVIPTAVEGSQPIGS